MAESNAAANTSPAEHRPGVFGSRLRDARIRTKLGLILMIPLLATVALAGVRLFDSGGRALEANLVRSLATVSVSAASLAHELHQERILAARLVADPDIDSGSFHDRSTVVDEAVEDYRRLAAELGRVPPRVAERLAATDEQLVELDDLRQAVLQSPPITVSATVLRYGAILNELLAYQESVGGAIENPALSEEVRAVATLSKAKAHAADAEAIAQVIAASDEMTEEQRNAFLATQTGQQEAFVAFQQLASPAQRAAAEAITGGNVEFAETGATVLLESEGGDQAAPVTAFAGMVEITRFVEDRLQEQLLATTERTRAAVNRQVLTESVAVLLALLVALAVAVLLARALARSLGQLRANATAVAERELPATVERLADPAALGEHTPAQLAAQVRESMPLRSRDEIGEVARSFTEVHRAAVRIAAEQAALRTSVSAMFLNLARRSQALVDRMIKQLDRIERREEDPGRLAELFVLDHLATRMRRNDENLLILAGADSSPPRKSNGLLSDVLRAAQSEVEHYNRIEFGTVDSDVSIASDAVNDVARLSAELFDNATRFSAPEAAVVCEARRLGDQVIIQVEDRGVGMTAEQVATINAWLAAPPGLEVTTFRRMGLAVVSRLAARHRIRVELRSSPNRGTTAFAALPRDILVLPPSRQRAFEPLPNGIVAPEPGGAASPPAPARRLGQLPQRSPAPANHSAEPDGPADPAGQALVWPPEGEQVTSAPSPLGTASADAGWQAAAAAANPSPDGTTTTGLPRRMPQAQLVPGSARQPGTDAPAPHRRTPDQVRGLLSSYHRGVQRGRENSGP